jgi:haloacetate dehalogenase
MLEQWSSDRDAFPAAVRAAYVEAFRDPATIHAICEEYRAASTLDWRLDEADRARRPIRCPVLALWSRAGLLKAWGDVLAVWREWADDVRGRPFDCGHFLAEEDADGTYAELHAFFSS